MIVLLAIAAWAGSPDLTSTTTVQVRRDLQGKPYVSGREVLFGTMDAGAVRLEGYGELGWPAGVDEPIVPELFVLSADGKAGAVNWTLGRQRVDLPTFGRMLDGGRVAWAPTKSARLEAWVGQARHVGLDGLTTGAPIARVAGTLTRGDLVATVGAWGELGDGPAVHPDLRLRWRSTKTRLAPDVSALSAVGVGAEGIVLERARLEGSVRPTGGVRAMVYGEHRQALSMESQLGPSILASFAPNGADEIGAAVGWTDSKRSQLWVEGSVQLWTPGDGDARQGVTGSVSWRPSCATDGWCAYPSWHGGSGPGGVYNALGTTLLIPAPDAIKLRVQGMVVPYRKPYHEWDTALVFGSNVEFHPASWAPSLVIGGEVARSAIAPIAPRAWVALRLEAL